MAGVRYSVRVNDAEVQEALNQLIKRGADLTPAMANIGEELLISHDQRFRDQKSPDGVPWAPFLKRQKR
nr:phage virion morphogenesis protein [Vibrio navarrensis]